MSQSPKTEDAPKVEDTPRAEDTKQDPKNDDEPDDWDKRIFSTGCADEQKKLNDCYFEKKDWRVCKQEMELFKRCWKAHSNDQRTETIPVYDKPETG